MDMKDGEVRVRTIIESDTFIGDEMLDRVVLKNLDLANDYQAPILAIAFGSASPENALEMTSRGETETLQ